MEKTYLIYVNTHKKIIQCTSKMKNKIETQKYDNEEMMSNWSENMNTKNYMAQGAKLCILKLRRELCKAWKID